MTRLEHQMFFRLGGGGGQYVINSLHAMGTFMCLYKIEKTMYFILTSNIKSPYKFT